MVNYGVPVWQLVLDAAKGLNKSFTSAEIIKKIKEKNPNVKSVTIRCHVIGMAPNHPSSKYYPSLSKNHPTFSYLGNGQFELLNEQEQTIKQGVENGMSEWEKLKEKIVDLQSVVAPFKVEFLDRDSFKRFCDNLDINLSESKGNLPHGIFL